MRLTRRYLRLLVVLLLPVAALLQGADAAANRTLKETSRFGMFMLGSRIGSMSLRTYEVNDAGKRGFEIESDSSLKVQVLGQNVEQESWMSHATDAAGKPVRSRYRITSFGRTTHVDAEYKPGTILCKIESEGVKSTRSVEIPSGANLTIDPSLSPEKANPKVGDKEVLSYLEPTTISIQTVRLTVEKKASRMIGGRTIEAFLMKSQDSLVGAGESWVDSEGRLLEENTALGISIVREDIDREPDAGPLDLALATAVETNVKIAQPRQLRFMKARFSGIPRREMILSDVRQRVSEIKSAGDDAFSALYSIEARPLPPTGAPLRAGDARETADVQYLDLGDGEIKKQALAIVDGAKDRAEAARKIAAWVNAHMKDGVNVALPRGAAEIMKSRQGVCRDYATLFTSLARTVGIPTRICSGIIYHEGKFFYHAWVECRIEESSDGWYALDPTLKDELVDATHVKFSQGDPSSMYRAVSLVGQLKAEVLDPR